MATPDIPPQSSIPETIKDQKYVENIIQQIELEVEKTVKNLLDSIDAKAQFSQVVKEFIKEGTIESGRVIAHSSMLNAVVKDPDWNFFWSLVQTGITAANFDKKLVQATASIVARLGSDTVFVNGVKYTAKQLAKKAIANGIARGFVGWIAPRVTASVATAAGASLVPGIGWGTTGVIIASWAYTLYSLKEAFVKTSLYTLIMDGVEAAFKALKNFPADLADLLLYYMVYTPSEIDKSKCLAERINCDGNIATKYIAKNTSEKLIDTIVPRVNAQQSSNVTSSAAVNIGSKVATIAVMKIFHKKLATFVDRFVANPLGRSVSFGSIFSLSSLVAAKTWTDVVRERDNLKKVEEMIQKIKNLKIYCLNIKKLIHFFKSLSVEN